MCSVTTGVMFSGTQARRRIAFPAGVFLAGLGLGAAAVALVAQPTLRGHVAELFAPPPAAGPCLPLQGTL